MNELTARVRRLLASSRGVDEPRFDAQLRIVNWPESLERELTDVVAALQSSTNSSELRACADLLIEHEPLGVPEGLFQILSRATFDNPKTPLREN
jgi:hypothetical protein